MPPEFQNYSCKTQKTNQQSFSDCRSRWSKELQWKNDYGFFLPHFLLVQVGANCFVKQPYKVDARSQEGEKLCVGVERAFIPYWLRFTPRAGI